MVLKLYGYSISSYTRLVALICKEKNIPYELVPVDLAKGEHKAAGFVQNQPFGQVPYIDDEGFILYESQGTTGLIPTDPKEEALFEQAVSVWVSHFNSHAGVLVWEKLIKVHSGGVTDEAKVEENLKSLEAKLDVYDKILGKQNYLAGDKVTLADLQHLPSGSALPYANLGYLFEKRPNVARWWKDIYNRPAWQAVKDGA